MLDKFGVIRKVRTLGEGMGGPAKSVLARMVGGGRFNLQA